MKAPKTGKISKKTAKFPAKPSLETIQRELSWLRAHYPDSRTELTYEGPFQLVAAVILSAQCTDARVNLTTPALFQAFPNAPSMAKAPIPKLEKLIQSCGFYRMKAKALKGMAQRIETNYGGKVPADLDELTTLPGVGRKTASVVLNQAFEQPAIAVDTHVKRVSNRLGWAHYSHPVKIEFELRELLPEKDWSEINGLLILHGRKLCKARKPLCEQCGLKADCPYYKNN